jgi:Raf kinase inhibitor-like YbhB/YbcL family protein
MADKRPRSPILQGRLWTLAAAGGALALALSAGATGANPILALGSSAFGDGQPIPSLYTCEGKNVSPPLYWSRVPAEAKALALVVDDPDAPDPAAPRMTWAHWVLYNIPASATGLPEAASSATMPQGTLQGRNDWHRLGYGGPCPPIGRHRYFFKLYALDALLPDLGGPSKADLERAMAGHVVGEAQLVGTYRKGD